MDEQATAISGTGMKGWRDPHRCSANRDCGRLDIRFATTPRERDAVFRFRHRVLGRRRGREMGYTASNGRLLEELDVDSDLLAAFGSGNVVHATIRLEDFEAACTRRGLGFTEPTQETISSRGPASFSSRLLVDPGQNVHLTVRILASLVTSGARRGIQRDYCSMSKSDEPLRTRLGYRESDFPVDVGGRFRLMVLPLPQPKVQDDQAVSARSSLWRGIRRRGSGRP